MSIQLLDGSPLIVDGTVAIHADCCCTPSCIPNECVIPSSGFCKYCWDAECNDGQCLEWQSLEFSVDGVGEVKAIPSYVPNTTTCRTGWDCNCDLMNSTFIHDFTTSVSATINRGTCETTWGIDDIPIPVLYDVCKNTSLSGCGFFRIRRTVFMRLAFANQQVSYTTGVQSSVTFPNWTTLASPGTNGLVVCNNYTLTPGHYVVVSLFTEGSIAATGTPIPIFSDTKYFIYAFGNGAKVDPGCADDQYYPACGPYIGGNATLLLSSRYSCAVNPGFIGPRVYIADCGSYGEVCDLSTATVTIEDPVIELCQVIPPPPPKP